MGIVPIRKRRNASDDPNAVEEPNDWLKLAAGAAMVAGGLLLLGNRRRAGALVSLAGAGLALVDQQDAVRNWWNHLPEYVDRVQNVINQVQSRVDEFTAKRESLQNVLSGNR
jgi:hypothetical protein